MTGEENAGLDALACDHRPMVSWHRRLLSGVFVFFVAMLVVINAPASSERSSVLDDFAHPIDLLHLNQSWAVFSPDPSNVSVEFWADVELQSGEMARYAFPEPGRWMSVYANYRFRKFQRRMVEAPDLQPAVADRIAREFDEPVASISLHRRFVTTPKPGSGDEPVETVELLLEVSYGPDVSDDGEAG